MAEPTGAHPAVREILGEVRARPPEEFVSLVLEIAVVDGSHGWLAATFNAAAYEVAAADDVWSADPNALVATSFRGNGVLGHDRRLTGRWDSVVGAKYADWLLLSADDGVACRILVPAGAALIEPVSGHTGLSAAGVCDVAVSDLAVDQHHIVGAGYDRTAVVAAAGAAAAVVGSAEGVWSKHVDQVRARLATSYGAEAVTDKAAAQVAWAASDIDAAKLQVTNSLQSQDDRVAAAWAYRQAVARAREAADRLLANSWHALDASEPVTRMWRDVHAGCRLAVQLFDGLESASPS